MPQVKDIIRILENYAPVALQEDWDNCGLQVGEASMEVTSALCTLDVTLEVVEEAIAKGCNMIVTHHPLIFGGLKSLTGRNEVEKCVLAAIKNDIAIYAAHTNMDSVLSGVNGKIAEKLQLQNCKILAPQQEKLVKLAVYVPQLHVSSVREAIFAAGAGHIGNYDSCSFAVHGDGSFRALDEANPYVGKPGELHFEKEVRLEVVLPEFIKGKVVSALKSAHPYEEVAYDLFPIKNEWSSVGLGMVGDLVEAVDEEEFLAQAKEIFKIPVVRHSPLRHQKIKRVALLGGSGASFLRFAISEKADIFLTADIKYHEFFIPEGRIVMADIGHYESEQYTKELFKEILTKKLTTFAARISETDTNKVKYC